jgi:hypothetical protein
VGSTLLVQNSGSPQLFGGLDAGAGGVSIVNTGTSPATVVAYGRQTRANGTVASNAEFPGAVSFSGQGGFVQGSAVNGCAVGSSACGAAPPPPPPPPPPPAPEEEHIGIDMASILGPLQQASPLDDGYVGMDEDLNDDMVEAENEDLDQDQVQDQDQDVNEDLNQSTSESEDEQDEGDNEDGSKVDPSMRLINTTPINIEQQIDDPVTSGGDIVVGYSPN